MLQLYTVGTTQNVVTGPGRRGIFSEAVVSYSTFPFPLLRWAGKQVLTAQDGSRPPSDHFVAVLLRSRAEM